MLGYLTLSLISSKISSLFLTYTLNIFYIMIFCRDRLERTIIH
eukprot:COSAG01_NODE_379_length_17872_cov_8.030102_13_plen_43_part_00